MSILKDSFGNLLAENQNKFGRSSSPSNNAILSGETLLCISDMVTGLGSPFHTRVLSLLEPMLQSGLTIELINTLTIISKYMPNQRNAVQSRLLEETTQVFFSRTEFKQHFDEPDYYYSWTRKGQRKSNQRIEQIDSYLGAPPHSVNSSENLLTTQP
jgi:hypothetical protein